MKNIKEMPILSFSTIYSVHNMHYGKYEKIIKHSCSGNCGDKCNDNCEDKCGCNK